MPEPSRATGNRLLDTLPEPDFDRLKPLVTEEWGEIKQVLLEPGARIQTVHFPASAVVSVLTGMDDGSGVEIATIGSEGMVGSPLFLGSAFMPRREWAQVQVPGGILTMDASAFGEEAGREGPFRDIVQRYVQALFSQVSQQVACNGLHSVEERCSRWLLLTHDRVGSDEFPLTQEFLSQMLGVRRASVTVAAGALQRAGFIRYRRGQIALVDREGLEGSSCECYQVIRDEFDRLLGNL
ncbi:MAG: Crp/Fnr family transcriptional regulator [Acidimicrobiales bacterium]